MTYLEFQLFVLSHRERKVAECSSRVHHKEQDVSKLEILYSTKYEHHNILHGIITIRNIYTRNELYI